jgi:acyl-CoA dehydrogenase
LKAHLLPGLLHLDRRAPEHYHGAQFLTEIQGGSDVGANAVRARRDGEHFRISGEKWFCSVIDADLYLMTARLDGSPSGTPDWVRLWCRDCFRMGLPMGFTFAD